MDSLRLQTGKKNEYAMNERYGLSDAMGLVGGLRYLDCTSRLHSFYPSQLVRLYTAPRVS